MKKASVNKVIKSDPLEVAERKRSDFVRELVQRRERSPSASSTWPDPTPKNIVQFWDDMKRLPDDVKACMNSWRQLEQDGFEIEIFDKALRALSSEPTLERAMKTHLTSATTLR